MRVLLPRFKRLESLGSEATTATNKITRFSKKTLTAKTEHSSQVLPNPKINGFNVQGTYRR